MTRTLKSDQQVSDVQTAQPMQGRAGASFAGAIDFVDVSYGVGQLTIIDQVSLSFAAGKVTCLLGESGCGKTTVLRLAAGVVRPQSGRITIGGFEVAGPKAFEPPERRNVGLMFQDYALFPHLTVVQNVAYGLYALSKHEALPAAVTALERVGLAHLAHSYPNSLSGGEQQRVALARAIVPRPQVLLMDEPFSGLDQRLREKVRADTLAIVRETRATAVLVTHDPQEAMAFGDYIYLLRQGKVEQHGVPTELYSKPQSSRVAQFFEAYNVFSGRVKDGAVHLPIGKIAAPGFADDTEVEVLLRPDGVRLAFTGLGASAYVLESRMVAASQHIRLLFSGEEKPVEVILPHESLATVGQMHDFVINPRSILVFKKSDSALK